MTIVTLVLKLADHIVCLHIDPRQPLPFMALKRARISRISRPTLVHNQPTVQWITGALSMQVQESRA